MIKNVSISVAGLLVGILFAYLFILHPSLSSFTSGSTTLFTNGGEKESSQTKEVIGFLPYWLAGKARLDYSPYITQLAYFSLTVDTDGSILKLTSPVEAEPGWYALNSGRMNSFFTNAKKNHINLALTVFNGDSDKIEELVADPVAHASRLASDVIPVMKEHGFSELNLDIENTREATEGARQNFNLFMKTLQERLAKVGATMTVDITGMDLIKHDMIDPKVAGKIADRVMVMTYDFHYAGSQVTGAVAPLTGAGITAEYDVQSAIEKAKEIIPSKKIILGLPLYGYEWETIGDSLHSGVIPGTGITASSQRIDSLFASCSTCSAVFDPESMESYLIYKDTETNTYHQLSYPDQKASQAKVDFARQQELGGIGMWALGYEGKDILEPLKGYIKE